MGDRDALNLVIGELHDVLVVVVHLGSVFPWDIGCEIGVLAVCKGVYDDRSGIFDTSHRRIGVAQCR
jgi:hypothetical protein